MTLEYTNNNDVATTAAAVDKEVMSHKIVRILFFFFDTNTLTILSQQYGISITLQ